METAHDIVRREGVPETGTPLPPNEAYAWYDLAQSTLERGDARGALAVAIYLCYRIGSDETEQSVDFMEMSREVAVDAWLEIPKEYRPDNIPSHVLYGIAERRAAGRA